jgi:hypothetical protein
MSKHFTDHSEYAEDRIQRLEAKLAAVRAERDALRETLLTTLAHLVAATDLLERGGRKAAPSDKLMQIVERVAREAFKAGVNVGSSPRFDGYSMFVQMLADYNAAIKKARAALEAGR